MKNKIKVSIIAPCFNEEKNIDLFYNEIVSVFNSIEDAYYELIFLDDSSSDDTVSKLKK